ncbi:MAG: hypothetical protein V1746_03245 [bacterium]
MNNPIKCDISDIEKNKPIALFSYLFFLVLVPLLAARDSRFATYHANQGLILLIIAVPIMLLSRSIVGWLTPIPVVGALFYIGGVLLPSLAWLGAALYGVNNCLHGECKPLPFIGHLFTIISYKA